MWKERLTINLIRSLLRKLLRTEVFLKIIMKTGVSDSILNFSISSFIFSEEKTLMKASYQELGPT